MDTVKTAMIGKIITEFHVFDECVCMQSVKQFFTNDAWKTIEVILTIKQVGCVYNCTIYELEINDNQDESSSCLYFRFTQFHWIEKQSEKDVLVLSCFLQPHYNLNVLNKAPAVGHGYLGII